MNSCKIKYYYTLKEICGDLTPYVGGISLFTLMTQTRISMSELYVKETQTSFKQYVEDLFKLIYARYWEHFCIVSGEELTRVNALELFLIKFFTIIRMNYDRYSTLLNIYSQSKSRLLERVKSVSSGANRFNDTPQNGGEFDEDDHTTTITETRTETETDAQTLMARIKEIESSFNDLMLKWSDEFDSLFIEEGNIND